MAEQVSRIIIKSSTGSETPATGDLHRGELGYSYKSDRLFIGNETDDSHYVIGGRAFFELFNDIVDGNGNAQHGIVYPHNVIIAGPNKDLDELDIKLLKVDGQVLTSSATTLNLFSSIDSLETDNALPNVTHTQIATSKAIKEYVDEKTDLISDFINSTPLPGQLLVGNDQNKFEYVDVTGVIQFSSTGLTSYTPSSVTNNIIENPTIQIGLQVAELGTTVVPNLNVDTSGVLNVNRGGSGKTELNKNEILIGDYTSPIASSNNFTYDVANNVFKANAVSYIKNVEIENNLQVNQDALIVGELTVNGVAVFNQPPSFTGDITFPENLTVEKNAYVIGDLYVSGNTVSVEAQRVLVEDNIIVLGANNTTDLVDLGFVGQYDGNRYAGIVRSALDDKFYVLEDYFPEPGNTLHNFDSNTMYGVIRGIFEATDISIQTGTATDIVINDSDLTNVDITFSTADELAIDNATANNLTIVRSDITDLFANNTYAQSVTLYNALNLATSATSTLSGSIIFDNASINVLNNSNFNISGILNVNQIIAESTNSNNISGNVYSGIYLDMIEDVNGNATVGQLLTADGLGNYFFANAAAGFLVDLLDVQTGQAYQSNTILTAFGNGEFYFSNTVSVDELISIDNTLENVTANNVIITTLVSTEITTENINVNNTLTSNIIVANTYSGIYLDMLENVNATANIDQVLTSNGAGGFYFANAATELKELTDVNSTASNNQVLTADGLGNFYFANNIHTTTFASLVDVNTNSSADEILTSYGNGVFYFSNTLTNVQINSSDADNLIANNSTLENSKAIEEFLIEGVSTSAGKLILNCEINTHGQTIIAQPHSAGVTNILTLPAGGNQELVGTTATQTLTNKTLTSAIINTSQIYDGVANNLVSNNATINDSTLNNVLITSGIANNTTLNNPTLNNAEFTEEILVLGVSGTSGKLILNCEVNTHGQTIIAQPHSAGVTNILTLPAGSDQEIVGTTATQTLTNKTLTSPTINSATISSSTINSSTINNSTAINLTSNNATLNDPTLNSPLINNAEFTEELLVLGVTGTSGKLILNCEINTHGQTIIAQPHSAGVTNILTLPAGGNQELVGTTATQTLTNKTLTSPVLNTAQINNSIADGLTSNNATINTSEINDSTYNNVTIVNGTASNLTLNDATLNSNTTFNGYVTINNTLEVANDLHVDGDLFVNGNTITLDAQTLTVEDNIVVLGSNNVSDITDLGFAFKYNDGSNDAYAGLFRDATDEKFYLFKDFLADPPVTTMTGFNSSTMLATLFGNFEANNLIASSGNLENMIANNITMTYSTIENSVIDCGTF